MKRSDHSDQERVMRALDDAKQIRTIRRRNPRLSGESLSATVEHEMGGRSRVSSSLDQKKAGAAAFDRFLDLPRGKSK
tara:strand:- start:1315 stop:1548 length:234 start_codon:yes stop_codon:yes gene_type:complete